MYCRYGGHLSNNDERTQTRACTKLLTLQLKLYSDHLHYENMPKTVINSREQTVAMGHGPPYNAMASDANQYNAMKPSSTQNAMASDATYYYAMEHGSTYNAMAHGATISNAMEPSSKHQNAMAHGSPTYNAMRLGPNNFSKAITHQASSNSYYFTQPGTMPSYPVGCSVYQDMNMQSMYMPDHQVVSVASADSKQDIIMQNKASTTIAMPPHSPLPCTGANTIPLPITKYQNEPIPLPRRLLMNHSNINEKDETTNTAPSCSCTGLLSSSNLSKPQTDSTLLPNTMTLPQHPDTLPHQDDQHFSQHGPLLFNLLCYGTLIRFRTMFHIFSQHMLPLINPLRNGHGGLKPCFMIISQFVTRRMSKERHAKRDIQKDIQKLLMIMFLLFHLVMYHQMFVLIKEETINV